MTQFSGQWWLPLLSVLVIQACVYRPSAISLPAPIGHQGPGALGDQPRVAQVVGSPDRTRWAVLSSYANQPGSIFVSDLAGHDQRLTSAPAGATRLAWSGDGALITYDELLKREKTPEYADFNIDNMPPVGSRLWAIAPDGSQQHVLVEGEAIVSTAPAPAGPYVAYTSRKLHGPTALHLIDLQTRKDSVITEVSDLLHGFRWSPDGSRVIFTEQPPGQTKPRLVVVDRHERTREVVEDYQPDQIFWQGEKVAMVSSRDVGRLVLYDVFKKKAKEVMVSFPSNLLQRTEGGWYIPSPDGTKLVSTAIGLSSQHVTMFSTTEKRGLDLTGKLPGGHFLIWKDNHQLLSIPASFPVTAATVAAEVRSYNCTPSTEVRFDFLRREAGAGRLADANWMEPPYIGGPYLYYMTMPQDEGDNRGVVTFRLTETGPCPVLVSRGVPVTLLRGSLWTRIKPADVVDMQKVEADGYDRYDVSLQAGDYSLEIGATSSDVRLAVPRAVNPQCIEKAYYDD